MKDLIPTITALTGLIGTLGGVVISYLSLRHAYRADRHTIKLSIKEGFLVTVHGPAQKNDVTKNMLIFSTVNTGKKDFTAVQIGLKVGHWKELVITNPTGSVKLPHALRPDETCSFWTEFEELKRKIEKPPLRNKIRVRGYISDYSGNTFWSKKMTIVLKETWDYRLSQYIRDRFRVILNVIIP